MGGIIALGVVFFCVCIIPMISLAIRSLNPKNRINSTSITPQQKVIVEQHIEVKQDTTPAVPNRTLAEQFDTRLTNVFTNPLEGIL